MDDPTHAASRDGGLNQLRKTKFRRHKSYKYGDASGLNKSSIWLSNSRSGLLRLESVAVRSYAYIPFPLFPSSPTLLYTRLSYLTAPDLT
jgi:hypothetical protein